MFVGTFEHTLDDKGRVILPARFREALADGVIITVGLDECLFAIPRAEWPAWENKVRGVSESQSQSRGVSRFFFANAIFDTPSRQGKILIPDFLRKYAGLTRDIVITGQSNRLEIWDKAKWESYSQGLQKSYTELAEKTGLGL